MLGFTCEVFKHYTRNVNPKVRFRRIHCKVRISLPPINLILKVDEKAFAPIQLLCKLPLSTCLSILLISRCLASDPLLAPWMFYLCNRKGSKLRKSAPDSRNFWRFFDSVEVCFLGIWNFKSAGEMVERFGLCVLQCSSWTSFHGSYPYFYLNLCSTFFRSKFSFWMREGF